MHRLLQQLQRDRIQLRLIDAMEEQNSTSELNRTQPRTKAQSPLLRFAVGGFVVQQCVTTYPQQI